MALSASLLFVTATLWLFSGSWRSEQKLQEPIPVVFHRLESESPTEVAEAARQLLVCGKSEPIVKEYLGQHLP